MPYRYLTFFGYAISFVGISFFLIVLNKQFVTKYPSGRNHCFFECHSKIVSRRCAYLGTIISPRMIKILTTITSKTTIIIIKITMIA